MHSLLCNTNLKKNSNSFKAYRIKGLPLQPEIHRLSVLIIENGHTIHVYTFKQLFCNVEKHEILTHYAHPCVPSSVDISMKVWTFTEHKLHLQIEVVHENSHGLLPMVCY